MNTDTNYAALFYSGTDTDTGVLEKTASEYPASSVAHFLLLYHHKKNNHPAFEDLAIQTAVYFTDPFWIQFQLSDATDTHFDSAINRIPAVEHLPAMPPEDNVLAVHIDKEGLTGLPAEPAERSLPAEQILKELPENAASEQDGKVMELTEQGLPVAVTEQISGNTPVAYGTSPEDQEEVPQPQKEGYEAGNSPLSEVIPQEPETDTDEPEESIAFEPLHTVDYFASQGIKINEAALENDHLGKQVKSFTAWLKSMKKLHPGQIPEQNEVIEKIIQSSSEASNQNVNVLTETMAEVLIKQGKRERAVEMYEKLSLMNPSKSAYFAAKIESLKTI